MENQRKKLRLEDINVQSFVTQGLNRSKTVRGGFPESYTCGDKTPGEISALVGDPCDDSWTCPLTEGGTLCTPNPTIANGFCDSDSNEMWESNYYTVCNTGDCNCS